MKDDELTNCTRRTMVAGAGLAAAGAVMAHAANAGAAESSTVGGKTSKVVDLNWNEVYCTNCPLISASNVDQELGWVKEEMSKIGIDYAYFRSRRETNWYPHYIHNQENLIRFGGLFPPIHVHADLRRTRLLGLTQVPYEGGCMMVRARDDIYRMSDLKGKKIGITKSLNTIKNDWWRIQEHMGILAMLRINGMIEKDVQLVDFPYPDDWYDDPKMLEPLYNPTEWQLNRDHKHDLVFRPLETSLLEGKCDAIYSQSKVFQHIQEATGEMKAIEDLSKHPDWTLQVANIPAAITCTEVMAKEHPELVVAFLKGMYRVGRWANEHKHAASVILNKQTYYLDVEDTYRGIKHVDMVPNLSPQNLACVEIGKDFMLKHGYIKNDFDVHKWAAPEFAEQAAKELLEASWEKRTQEEPNWFEETHAWDPARQAHAKMRCIVCHTPVDRSNSHEVLSSDQAIRNCDACHDVNAPLIAEYIDLADPSLWVTNPLLFKEAFLPGATRNRVLDGLLKWLFWLTVFGVLGHGLLRVLTRRRRPRVSAEAEKVKMYPVWLRVWHWSNAILFVVLAYTGVRLHFGQRRGPIMSFETAFDVHNLAGSLLVVFGVLFFIGNLLGRNQHQYLSRPIDGMRGIIRQLRWYLISIFKGEPHPYHAAPEHKFNPLQHLTYVGVMYVMVPLLLLSGVALLFPGFLPEDVLGYPGVFWMAAIHWILAAAGILFMVGHLYLGSMGDKVRDLYAAMLDGYHRHRKREP